MEHTVNMNAADCIKSATDWSVTHYTNVCTGAQYTIDNGSFDQILAGSIALLLISGVVAIAALVCVAIFNMFSY